MNFNKVVKDKLDLLMSDNNFDLTEQFEDSVRYENNGLYLSFCHNLREKSNIFWVGRDKGIPIEMSNRILNQVFNCNIKIETTSVTKFISNVYNFLITDGISLLKANEKVYFELEKTVEKQSKEYTSQLKERQYLEAAEKAWRNKNYSDVLKNLNKVDENRLSDSFKKKYNIASKNSDS